MKRNKPYWLLTKEELISPLNLRLRDKVWSGFRIWSVTMATGAMSLQRKAALPSLLKVIQRSEKVVNLPQKLSCKVQKLTRCHMKIFLKVSKSKYFCSRSSKKFLQIFFFFLFIKIDAFKPTSKRFRSSLARYFFKNLFCLLSV